MAKKSVLLTRFIKNILSYGLIFIILSVIIDWYRKPTEPHQFAQQVLYDLDQHPRIIVQLSHQQPMLLYFWGTWCRYCQFTSAAVQQLANENIPILTIALKSGDEKDISNYLTQQKYTFPTINDPDGNIAKNWTIQATPTIIFIKDGKIVEYTTGLTSYWGLKSRLWLANLN
ncbi:protein disulfide oxidoreductase [[Haemophilus] ducreyi]|uniref:protein disulfide oxidoreductase n=1 Tax=Haemophilus ducreyi TaxID=730 RepID=UPI00065578E2|nr:protein disulfide oxidoreductase [[Haemophilus] ducreyi]AKO45159.1 thioredoxin [[Haemophilus] ducreyi]AKO46561.1 thioredoxin [[Haemophilus] ducreyi]AKO47902.1 thioredoxin [[Haemophilus] ducreyi]AKO49290.1 thioredoxin [[Haemophilus] ducreyi]OOS03316.1 protein disulfide oxidoreductase [[Haemophilus] ducreyi]